MLSSFRGRNNNLLRRAARVLTHLRGDYPDRLPDFLVIGATRSGTTTLNRILLSHSQIFVPAGKELHYFDNDALYRRELAGYRQLFGGYRGEEFIGEVTPDYWEKGLVYPKNSRAAVESSDDAILRIARSLPDAKLIVSLRDPLSRIRSNYIKSFYQGKVSGCLEDEVRQERSGPSRLMPVRRSQYHDNLRHIFDHFPRENVRILIFEEWTADQSYHIPDLLRFIGANPDSPLPTVSSNESGRYRKARDSRQPDAELSVETRSYLIQSTAESREYLENLLGRPMPWARE